jgi:hypothetical protein
VDQLLLERFLQGGGDALLHAFPSSMDSTTIPVGMLRKKGDGNTSFTRSAFA